MSGEKYRSGDTVPPELLGEDPALERALGQLTQGLRPGEDALFTGPDWAERAAAQQEASAIPTAMPEASLVEPERASGAGAAAQPVEMPSLFKKQLITVRTRTVSEHDRDDAAELAVSAPNGQSFLTASVDTASPGALSDGPLDGPSAATRTGSGAPLTRALTLALLLAGLLLVPWTALRRGPTPDAGAAALDEAAASARSTASARGASPPRHPARATEPQAAPSTTAPTTAPSATAPTTTTTPSATAPSSAPRAQHPSGPLPGAQAPAPSPTATIPRGIKPEPAGPAASAPAPNPLWLLND